MSTPLYIKNLTPLERGAAIKLGACLACAQHNTTPEEFRKKADFLDGAALFPKSILVASLLAGIPLGVMGHAIGRSIAPDNRQEREALDRLRYYQRMTAGMQTGLEPATNNEEEKANVGGRS